MSRLFGNMKWTLALTVSAMMIVTGFSAVSAEDSTESPAEEVLEAVYLGVKDYGKEKTNKDNKENFLYRFGADAEEIILRIDNGTKDEEEL